MEVPGNILTSIFWVLGGLGMFIYGIDMMGRSLRKAAGSAMRKGLDFLTRTRFHGLLTGTVVTGMLQSSSATTVMVVGFISAGLMTFPQSIGVILGANIGSTVTPQITAFNLDGMAIPMLGIGFLINVFSKKRVMRKLGMALMGFGMLFFGLVLMKFAVTGYSDNIRGWLEACIAGDFYGQLLAFVVTMIATAIIQSSGATVVMIVALASQGAIPNVEIAIPMILGAGVGTCITAVLASLKASRSAKKAAIAHLLFNTIGSVITVAIFKVYTSVIPLTSDSVARQIANCHVAIKLVNALVFLPITPYFAGLVNLIMRGEDKLDASPAFLDQKDVGDAEKAFENVQKEVQRMCVMCLEITRDAVNAFFSADEMMQELILQREDLTDDLYDSIADYVLDASSAGTMPSELSSRPPELMQALSDVERIGDHAENIVEISQTFRKNNVRLSDPAAAEVLELMNSINAMGEKVVTLFDNVDKAQVDSVRDMHTEIKELEHELLDRHEQRLADGKCSVIAGIVFTDLITNLRRVANHLRNVAMALSNQGVRSDRAEI